MAEEKIVGKGVPFERIRRITGYLVGTMDRWNNAKRAEERDRTKHSIDMLPYKENSTCKIFTEFREEIESYCAVNGLDAEKVFSSPKSFNNDYVILQWPNIERGKMGLRDESPAPATLRIFRTESGLRFEQTELTKSILSKEI